MVKMNKKKEDWGRANIRIPRKDDQKKFERLFRESGARSKSTFVRKRIFGSPFKVIHRDRSSIEVVNELQAIGVQIRRIGYNYNQVVKRIHVLYEQSQADFMLASLTEETRNLADLLEKVERIILKYDSHDS